MDAGTWGRQRDAWRARTDAALARYSEGVAGLARVRASCTLANGPSSEPAPSATPDHAEAARLHFEGTVRVESITLAVHQLLDVLAELRAAATRAL